MELSPKEMGTYATYLLSLGGLVTWIKININTIKDGLAAVKVDVAPLAAVPKSIVGVDKRLSAVEERFVTENGEPALLSFRAHRHICEGKNQIITQELKHVIAALDNNSMALKEHSEQVSGLSIAVAVLEEKVERNE